VELGYKGRNLLIGKCRVVNLAGSLSRQHLLDALCGVVARTIPLGLAPLKDRFDALQHPA